MTDSHSSNNLDLMRLAFASLVLVSHSAEILDGDRHRELLTLAFGTISFGELGVDCFFILSGFMISGSWDRDPRWWAFLRRRLLRIYPGFAVAFLLSVTVAGTLGAPDARAYLAGLDPFDLAKQMAKLNPPATPPTFVGYPHEGVNVSMWTIRYEFACYLLVPVLGLLGLLAGKLFTVGLWLASLLAFVAFRAGDGSGATAALMGGHAVTLLRLVPMFLAGAAIRRTGLHRHRSPWSVAAACCLLLAGLTDEVTAEPAVATVGAYLLFVAGFTDVGRTGVRRMPDVSYGVYLYGWPVQKLLIHWWPGISPPTLFASSLAASLVLGCASWFAVEKPALAFRPAVRLAVARTAPG